MQWYNFRCLISAISLTSIISLGYLSANPIQRQIPKVTEEIENFFKNGDLVSYSDHIHELIKGCRVVEHNDELIRMCTRRRLNRNFKNISERIANFIIKSCDKDDAPIPSYGQVLTTCMKKLQKDIAEGLLPRETPIQPVISANPEEQAVKEAENFLRNDADSFIENRLDDSIKYCYFKHDHQFLAQSCVYERLPHRKYILENCRKNKLLNREFPTAKEFKAELITCFNTLRKQLVARQVSPQAIEDVLSN